MTDTELLMALQSRLAAVRVTLQEIDREQKTRIVKMLGWEVDRALIGALEGVRDAGAEVQLEGGASVIHLPLVPAAEWQRGGARRRNTINGTGAA